MSFVFESTASADELYYSLMYTIIITHAAK
jgi:hypothetical protein